MLSKSITFSIFYRFLRSHSSKMFYPVSHRHILRHQLSHPKQPKLAISHQPKIKTVYLLPHKSKNNPTAYSTPLSHHIHTLTHTTIDTLQPIQPMQHKPPLPTDFGSRPHSCYFYVIRFFS